ncbi:helix-turn-helix transcriptional regulator [Shewanella sp.]|uniref:helix-turn-helix transcriptional regulator n=1 Tax=Shewanella sp. TaxID=50422 RepID=UPI0040543AFE
MQYLLKIQSQINELASLGQISEFLSDLGQDFNYLSCSLLLRNNLLASKALGRQSKSLQNCLYGNFDGVWAQLPKANIPQWVILSGVAYLACAFNQGAAVILIEPKQLLTAEQKQATALFWQLLASPLSECVQRVLVGDESPFTQAEIACIQWTADCKTPQEISLLLTISEQDVNDHIQHSLQKTGVSHISQLIGFCRQWGLLTY